MDTRLYLTLHSKGKSLGVDVIRAETPAIAKDAFEEVERVDKRKIMQMNDISGITADEFNKCRRMLMDMVSMGKDNFVFFDPFYDIWSKKKETEDVIWSYSNISEVINKTLIVGIDMTESNTYVNMCVDIITVELGLNPNNVEIINSHITDPMDRTHVLLNLINHKIKKYSKVIFYFANRAPYRKMVKQIRHDYPFADIIYSLEDRLMYVDRTLTSRYMHTERSSYYK